MQSYTGLVVATIILMVAESLVGTCIPMHCIDSVPLQVANCFAGGILLAVAYLSILAESTQLLIDQDIYYPWSYFICILLFIFIFIVDKLFGSEEEEEDEDEEKNEEKDSVDKILKEESHIQTMEVQTTQEQNIEGQNGEKPAGDEQKQKKESTEQIERQQTTDVQRQQTTELQKSQTSELQKLKTIKNEEGQKKKKKCKFPLTGFILMCAILLDGTLEGIALSLQTTDNGVIQLMIGFLTNQWSQNLLLGLNLKKQGTGKVAQFFIQLPIICSCPIGAGIGWSISGTDPLIEGILLSMAAGSFVYCSIFEMTLEEVKIKMNLKRKLCGYFIGVLAILALGVLGTTGKRETGEEE